MSEFPILLKLSHPEDAHLQKKAQWFSLQPGIKVIVESEKKDYLFTDGLGLSILHLTRKGTFLQTEGMRLSFHPSMALLRIIQLGRGEFDRFITATGIQQGDTLLDATLGLGTDALVAAHQVGEEGHIIAIEHSAILAALIRDGLATLALGNYPKVENPEKAKAWFNLSKAAQRINIIWGDHLEILTHSPTNSVDIVYFDPMFRHTREESASIRPLHNVSYTEPLQIEAVKEACRVARRRVVLKERKGSSEFSRLGFPIHAGGKYSHVDYGIIERWEESF